MSRSAHPNWERLLALLDDSSPSPELRAHVEACPECRGRLDEARRTVESLPDALDPGAPDTWRARAERRAVPRSFRGSFRGAHQASVVFDSAVHRLGGVRSGARGDRQWLLATGRFEIEIRLSDPLEQAPFQLSGQLWVVDGEAMELSDCRVRLEVDGRTRAETRTESNGEFLLKDRPEKSFRVIVEGEGWEISSPMLEP